ncbi:PD-(D/E)XK nuclease domain-containing protein [Microcoleus sp. herbarium2]|uniref:PD-(D/E)XK nuclease domain-containing protein n=1 Tax=Microcoleus sp. herbarium2 TaxID=3055433 RepID=UPI002FD11F62
MSVPDELLFTDAKKALLRELKNLVGRGNVDEAFAAWLLPELEIGLQLQKAALAAGERTGGQRSYRDVAILGFAAAANALEAPQYNVLKTGLTWVAGRDPFIDGGPMDFCTDTVALLGIALGAQLIGEDSVQNKVVCWMERFISESFQNRLSDWQKCLLIVTQRVVNLIPTLPIPNANTVSDIRLALRVKELLPPDPISNSQEQMETLSLMKLEAGDAIPPARAALRLAAFDSIQRSSPAVNLSNPSIEDVCRILNRVPGALQKSIWEEKLPSGESQALKWYVDDKERVQNLLYFLLASIFPDCMKMDCNSSVDGQIPLRTVLGIPCLRLIIYVNFMRSNNNYQSIIEQIYVDSDLYFVEGSAYSNIVVFFWDESRQFDLHNRLRKEIKQLRGVVDAVVVSCPESIIAPRSEKLQIEIPKNDVDTSAIAISFDRLAEKHPGAELEIITMKERDADKLLLEAKTAPDADRSQLSADYLVTYNQIKALPEDVKLLLKEKDSRIQSLEDMLKTAIQRPSVYAETYQNNGDTMSQGPKKVSKWNLQNPQIAGGLVDAETVHAHQIGGNITNYTPEQKQNLAEAAAEIQQLLQQLEQNYPTTTPLQKQVVVTEALKHIESNPTFKARVIGALKAGGTEALKELVDHPLINILIASLEGWQDAE